MPEPTYPPNVSQPRTLNRWLDVNSQNGPLSRTGTYFIIPAFSFAKSSIATIPYAYGIFNCSATKNFTIIELPDLSACDFMVVIACTDTDGTVRRYKLNEIEDLETGIVIPMYVNQKINKIFCIEIWSEETFATLITPITVHTSPKNAVDYCYGVDSQLATITVNPNIFDRSEDGTFPLPITFDKPPE